MSKALHIYLHTYDAAWEEQKHPRAKNGQFGSGGTAKGSGNVSLSGNELGDYTSMKELRQKALAHAEKFIGKSFKNASTGNAIVVTRSGVKHTIAGASDSLVRTIPAIPELLEKARLVKRESDRHGRTDVLGVETYAAPIVINGEAHEAFLTVKHYADGRRYYDHGLVK